MLADTRRDAAAEVEVCGVLGAIAPPWGQLRVPESGNRLGVYLGPGAGEQSWTSAQAKWEERLRDVPRRSVVANFLATLYV